MINMASACMLGICGKSIYTTSMANQIQTYITHLVNIYVHHNSPNSGMDIHCHPTTINYV